MAAGRDSCGEVCLRVFGPRTGLLGSSALVCWGGVDGAGFDSSLGWLVRHDGGLRGWAYSRCVHLGAVRVH